MQATDPKVGTFLKAGMYILSLWLLFLLIFVNKVNIPINLKHSFASRAELWGIAKENVMPILCVSALTLSFLFFLYFKHLIRGASLGPQKLLSVDSKGSEHLVFLATYVIPLVGFALENSRQIINFIITLAIIGSIYIKTNLFYANPTLSLLGFRVYEAEFSSGKCILISTEELSENDEVNYIVLDRKTYFVRKSFRVTP